jgi:hypothetical protein
MERLYTHAQTWMGAGVVFIFFMVRVLAIGFLVLTLGVLLTERVPLAVSPDIWNNILFGTRRISFLGMLTGLLMILFVGLVIGTFRVRVYVQQGTLFTDQESVSAKMRSWMRWSGALLVASLVAYLVSGMVASVHTTSPPATCRDVLCPLTLKSETAVAGQCIWETTEPLDAPTSSLTILSVMGSGAKPPGRSLTVGRVGGGSVSGRSTIDVGGGWVWSSRGLNCDSPGCASGGYFVKLDVDSNEEGPIYCHRFERLALTFGLERMKD